MKHSGTVFVHVFAAGEAFREPGEEAPPLRSGQNGLSLTGIILLLAKQYMQIQARKHLAESGKIAIH